MCDRQAEWSLDRRARYPSWLTTFKVFTIRSAGNFGGGRIEYNGAAHARCSDCFGPGDRVHAVAGVVVLYDASRSASAISDFTSLLVRTRSLLECDDAEPP